MTDILIGTSGWSYKEWVGPFYSDKKNWFSRYSEIFNTVEINSTFYAYPSENLIKGLAKSSPSNFVFSAKVPQLITHKKMLDLSQGVEADLKRFLRIMGPLQDREKLGPLLIQLPPRSKELFSTFEGFLETLPVDVFKFVVEFRDKSWMESESWKVLKDHDIAYCIVDEPLLPPTIITTSDVAYLRWHGKGTSPWYYYDYKQPELSQWSKKVLDLKGQVKEIFGYFNNHFRAYAPKNALQMLDMMSLANQKQKEELEKITSYFEVGAVEETKRVAQKAILKGDLNELLKTFLDKNRMQKAIEMDEEPSFTASSSNLVEGKIKGYDFSIDVKNRTLTHNCEDWLKRYGTKQFCKHLGRVFLSLPFATSLEILKDIVGHLDDWSFGPS